MRCTAPIPVARRINAMHVGMPSAGTADDHPPEIDGPTMERAPRVVTLSTVLAAIGAILLVVPEIWVAGGGFVWAVSGLAKLGMVPTAILAALVAVPICIATVHVVRWAFEAETDPENAEG